MERIQLQILLEALRPLRALRGQLRHGSYKHMPPALREDVIKSINVLEQLGQQEKAA